MRAVKGRTQSAEIGKISALETRFRVFLLDNYALVTRLDVYDAVVVEKRGRGQVECVGHLSIRMSLGSSLAGLGGRFGFPA